MPGEPRDTCLIALGSNLGEREENLRRAVELLAASDGIFDLRPSTWHVTRPVGGPPGQSEFLNAAARLETSLSPRELLPLLQSIEQQLGRSRTQRWDARSLDLDLLLYGDLCLRDDSYPCPLEIPHPRMAFRRFVLEPAAKVAAEMRHPKIGWTIGQLRDHLRIAPPYIAIAAADQPFAMRLAYAAACELQGKYRPTLPAFNAPAAGSTNSIAHSAIEYLRIFQSHLPAAAAWPPDELVIVDQYAPWHILHHTPQVEPQPLMDAIRGELVLPKLLVIRDVPIQPPGTGPMLDISQMDFDTALEELVAAGRAMNG